MNELQKKRLQRLARNAGFPVFFLFCFALFFLLLFPYDKLRDYIVYSFNAQQRGTSGQFEIQIDEVGLWWPPGFRAKGVHLRSLQSDPTKAPIDTDIDVVRARLSLWPLLVFRKDASFQIDAFGGSISGTVEIRSSERHIAVELDGIELGQAELIAAQVGLPILGKLSGKVEFTLPEGKASKANGVVALEGSDMAVGDGKTPISTPMGPFSIPKLNIGSLSIAGEAKDGKLQISKLSASGKDIDLSGEGTIKLREMPAESPCDLTLRFKINDSYRGKDDKTKTLFGEPGASGMKGQGLIDLDPKMKKAKQSDGFYAFRVGGRLGRMDPQAGGAKVHGSSEP